MQQRRIDEEAARGEASRRSENFWGGQEDKIDQNGSGKMKPEWSRVLVRTLLENHGVSG